jgi:hypothetical protein
VSLRKKKADEQSAFLVASYRELGTPFGSEEFPRHAEDVVETAG